MRTTVANTAVQTKRHARYTLIATDMAAAEARALVEITLISWDVRHLLDDAKEIVSELATNAFKHAGQGRPVLLALGREKSAIQLAVWDSSDELPVERPVGPMGESGRGLTIVRALSNEHGAYCLETGGKVVWARLEIEN